MSLEVLKQNSKSFYFAGYLLGSRSLHRIAALYNICRTLDDLADSAEDSLKARANLMTVQHAFASKDISNYLVMIKHRDCANVNEIHINSLITGLLKDTERVRIRTTESLLVYCYRVAGTVGLMICDIFRIQDPNARAHAIDLGVAMQLTNIARDVLEDAKMGRVYLPQELINDLTPKQIESPTKTDKIIISAAVSHLLYLADKHYNSGFCGLPFLPFRSRFSIFLAGRIYKRIGLKIRKHGLNVWSRRHYTSVFEKCYEFLICICLFIINLDNHKYTASHDSKLHKFFSHLPDANYQAEKKE